MGTLFNAAEVFTMAIQMEDNGAAFYRRAAELQKAQGQIDYLLQLAGMEDEHKRRFVKMREEAIVGDNEGIPFDLYDEGELYLSGIASGYRVEGSPAVADTLTGNETLAEILKLAVELEKDAILFYLGLKDVVPEGMGREQIDSIISEEKGHIVVLMKELQKVEGAASS